MTTCVVWYLAHQSRKMTRGGEKKIAGVPNLRASLAMLALAVLFFVVFFGIGRRASIIICR